MSAWRPTWSGSALVTWVCAVVACGRPEGEPHIADCPYYKPTADSDPGLLRREAER